MATPSLCGCYGLAFGGEGTVYVVPLYHPLLVGAVRPLHTCQHTVPNLVFENEENKNFPYYTLSSHITIYKIGEFFVIYITYPFWYQILSALKILFNHYIYKNQFQVHVLVCHLLNLKTVTSSVRPFCGLYNSTFLQMSTHINHVFILVSNNHSKVWGQRRWSNGKSNNWSEECTHSLCQT